MDLSEPLDQLSKNDNKNLNKYTMAGTIASKVLEELVSLTKVGAKVTDLCKTGDNMILEEVNKVSKKTTYKGIAFPTCVSINNMAGYFSPHTHEDKDEYLVKDGDLVKIELGVHMDGFPALVCFTVVVNDSNNKIDDERANVVKAVVEASRNVLKLMTPGTLNKEIVNKLKDTAEKYNCSIPVINSNIHCPGILSHQVSQDIIDGYNTEEDEFIHRFILNKSNDAYEFSMVDLELEENEVYAVDITMSTGKGKFQQAPYNTTIYKRIQDRRIALKLKTSRATLSHFGKTRFPIHSRDKDTRFKFGLKECLAKDIVEEYPPIRAKPDEYVARVMFTVIVRKKPILVIGRSGSSELEKVK